jgi:hypothetical protein
MQRIGGEKSRKSLLARLVHEKTHRSLIALVADDLPQLRQISCEIGNDFTASQRQKEAAVVGDKRLVLDIPEQHGAHAPVVRPKSLFPSTGRRATGGPSFGQDALLATHVTNAVNSGTRNLFCIF